MDRGAWRLQSMSNKELHMTEHTCTQALTYTKQLFILLENEVCFIQMKKKKKKLHQLLGSYLVQA